MNYETEQAIDRHLGYWVIGAGTFGAFGLTFKLFQEGPDWLIGLIVFAVSCWILGIVLTGLWRLARWFWNMLKRLEDEL